MRGHTATFPLTEALSARLHPRAQVAMRTGGRAKNCMENLQAAGLAEAAATACAAREPSTFASHGGRVRGSSPLSSAGAGRAAELGELEAGLAPGAAAALLLLSKRRLRTASGIMI